MDASSELTTWFITGSNRNLGIEMAIQLLADPSNFVIATSRNPGGGYSLDALRRQNKTRLHIVHLDLLKEDSIKWCARAVEDILGERGLDYLVNNAGLIIPRDNPFTFEIRGFLDIFRVNVLGPALILRAFLPLLEKGKRKVVVNISGRQGCFATAAEQFGSQQTLFSASKAALNMLTIKTACERPDLIIFALSPGQNNTETGGEDAPLDAGDTVEALLPFITSVTSRHSGKSWDYSGGKEVVEYPW